jgi:uncharacterized protein (TIGR03437 family)
MARTVNALAVLIASVVISQAQTYTITTIAGNGTAGFSGDGGAATAGQLNGPYGLAVDGSGSLYIADATNNRIRQVQQPASGGNITTLAGNGTAGFSGDGKSAGNAELSAPVAVAVDSSGNYYIADTNNSGIRKVAGGNISTIAGQPSLPAGYGGDGFAATGASLNHPAGVAVDSQGNVYISDTQNNRIRKVTVPSGIITTIAGNGSASFSGDGGPAALAAVNQPRGLAIDALGNLYIADTGNHRIRKITRDGMISTVAGNGIAGFSGDNGPATSAQLNTPTGVAVDSARNLYIADRTNSRIRKVTATGAIITIAGNGGFGYTGDGGPATSATIPFPVGVAVDANGNVFVSDSQNSVIRMLTPPTNASDPPIITGVQSAGAFGAFSSIAPGSWIEIYGSNLASTTYSWQTSDFKGLNAPTSLQGTIVTIAGQQAFIDYVSPNQVNAQVPSNIATGAQQITVTAAGMPSAAYPITVNSTQPGLYAPPQFSINGQQYVAAFHADLTTYVLPANSIEGIVSQPAKAGEIIILYGVGFGPVTPNWPAGEILQAQDKLSQPLQIFFGSVPAASIRYAGLTPGAVGLYQINVVVPPVAASNAVPLTFTLGGVSGAQTLFTAVQ